jgi:tetratricopeptide (TPR) repeat protein
VRYTSGRQSFLGGLAVRLTVAAFTITGCSSHPSTPATSPDAAAYYRAGQHEALLHHYPAAQQDFSRALALTSDPDQQAWALYQIASLESIQPAQKTAAIQSYHRLIHDYPRHFLAARAQSDIDRLEDKKPPVVVAAVPDPGCGPECLAFLLQHVFHQPASLQELRKAAGEDEHGATLLGLQKAARGQGLIAEGMKVDAAYFRQMKQPTLCWVKRSHYVAVTATPTALKPPFWAIIVYDPIRDRAQTLSPAQFSREWDGYVLALARAGGKAQV